MKTGGTRNIVLDRGPDPLIQGEGGKWGEFCLLCCERDSMWSSPNYFDQLLHYVGTATAKDS